jgi:futalosine hydrolase
LGAKPLRLTSCIGLLSAVPQEGRIILRNLGKIERKVSHGLALYKGKINGKSIAYIPSGIGKTNASYGATILIERFSPRIIINFGVGGAYPSSCLKPGDIAIAEKEIYGDEGVLLNNGFKGMETIGIPFLLKGRKKYFNLIPLNRKLVKKTVATARSVQLASPVTISSGPFLTLSAITGTFKRAAELEGRFHAICENMEGAAVAHICTLYSIPMIEIRGISNAVEDRNTKKWNVTLAAENCQKVVLELLRRL